GGWPVGTWRAVTARGANPGARVGSAGQTAALRDAPAPPVGNFESTLPVAMSMKWASTSSDSTNAAARPDAGSQVTTTDSSTGRSVTLTVWPVAGSQV